MRTLFYIVFTGLIIASGSCNNNASKEATSATADSSQTVQPSKKERNKQVIMDCIANINKHDIAAATQNYAPDFIEYGDGSMPPLKGDSSRMELQMFMAAFPDLKSANSIYCADGDYVMVYSDITGTWTGDIMGMKATGKPLKTIDVDVFKLNDEGKVTEHHNIQNVPCGLAMLGAKFPKQPAK